MAILSNARNENIANQNGAVVFKCPGCLKSDIVRSPSERQVVIKYKCTSCGFEGPN